MIKCKIDIEDKYLDYHIGDIVKFISTPKNYFNKTEIISKGRIVDYKIIASSRKTFTVFYKIEPSLLQNIFELSKDRIIEKVKEFNSELKYICKQCGEFETANSQKQIVQRKKICLKCSQKNRNDRKIKSKISSAVKVKNVPNNKMIICEYCKKEFEGKNARFCSSDCRKKGVEKLKFYKNLDDVNRELKITKTRVFGQGAYEKINYIKDIFKNGKD